MPQQQNLSLRLVWSLLHEPVWLGGIAALTAGFLLQASALGTGQLSLVEPVLVLELPVALILASRIFQQRLGRSEWLPAAGMTAGLGGLLYLLAPSPGKPVPVRWYAWLAGIAVNLALAGGLTALARRRPTDQPGRPGRPGLPRGSLRAALLAIAAGSTFGLTAALMKAMTKTLSGGFGELFASWPVYAMIAAGALGMFLTQSALNAGQLIAAQPGLTLSDPLVSVLWGVAVFGERVRLGWYVLGELACAGVIAAAVIMLVRSPLLSGGDYPSGDGRRRRADGGRPEHTPAPAGESA